jgi:thiol-disulfide isomerase/thioredoxin
MNGFRRTRLLLAGAMATMALAFAAPTVADEATRLPDLSGTPVDALAAEGRKAAVLFFVSPYCPTSNTFAPEMNGIVADFGEDFAFRFVHSDFTVTAEDRQRHAELMEFAAPVLDDSGQALAKRLGAAITPEVVVVAPDGAVLYQGRINDLYLGPTKRQREIKSHDLREALAAIREGRPVAEARTEAMGCAIVPKP